MKVPNYMTGVIKEWSEADLGEMYGFVDVAEAMKSPKVQMDVQHAKDILMMAIEYVRLVNSKYLTKE